MHNPEHLSDADQERVNSVINSGYNDTERAPFRFYRLFGFLTLCVILAGVIARIYAKYLGVI